MFTFIGQGRELLSTTLRCAVLAVVLSSLAGCASPLPKSLQQDLPQSPDLHTVLRAPPAHIGERVRWGGLIIKVENLATGSQVEILARPLDASGRPTGTGAALGRFIAHTREFLDPLIYTADSEVTLTGTLSAPLSREIGNFLYTYPVVATEALHLWGPRPIRRDPSYWDDPWYPWGYPYPWWRHPYHPY